MQPNLAFQYCQKLVVLDTSLQKVLLAKRKGEADYDGTFSFIGGKMETSDDSLIAGMQREKDEEIGTSAKILVLPDETKNILFKKKDGNTIILPHAACIFNSGEINLSDEYSEYAWVALDELNSFEPKIDNIPDFARWAAKKLASAAPDDLVEI